jgi:ATP-binding cassette subfamily B protein
VPVLSLENLGFAYSATAAPALIGVEAKLYAGESLGVIGPTACGKTTLARLITRGCDPTEGCVRVNGCDLAALSEHERVAAIAYVPQHTQLLRGTVRSNLVWRDAGASDEDLWEALANAQIEGAIAHLPQGLEAPVAAGGGNFSGGQRQRLTIARALVGAPQILVLDDATSALDYLTERALIAALDAQAAATGQVRVVMSQRIASVAACTRVLVLDAGHVVDLGTHAELKARCALYQELCALQEAPAREEVCDG